MKSIFTIGLLFAVFVAVAGGLLWLVRAAGLVTDTPLIEASAAEWLVSALCLAIGAVVAGFVGLKIERS